MIETKNAIIVDAEVYIEDHGILTASIELDYGSSIQSFGNYAIEEYPSFLSSVLKIVGVYSWNKLIGKAIRVKAESTKVHAIGHITKDIWFNPSEEYQSKVGLSASG